MSASVSSTKDDKHFFLKLFVAGAAINSRVARDNLEKLRARLPHCTFHIEVVDVFEDPQQALAHGVYLTPALQIIEPEPGGLVFGNLSDWTALRRLFPQGCEADVEQA